MKTIIITESQLKKIVDVEKFKHSPKKKAKRVADKDIAQHFKKDGDPWGTDVNSSENWPRHTISYDTKFNFDDLNEEYEPEKLYSLEYLESAMRTAPKYLKKYINKTNVIEKDGKKFVRIPQVIYQYLTGNF